MYAANRERESVNIPDHNFCCCCPYHPLLLPPLLLLLLQVFAPIMGSIAVSDVAKVMIADAEAFKKGAASGVGVFEMKALQKAAAAGTAPQ